MNTSRNLLLPFAPPAIVALLALAVVAFWIPYFSQLPAASRYVHFHVATMLMWMGLLIAQPLLMRAGRRDSHRALGKATYLLMPLIFIASVLLAHFRQSQPGYLDQPGNLETLVLQIGSPLFVAGFFVMGLANRRTPAVHARWMLSTAILLIDPIVARVVVFHFPAHAAAAEWLGPSLAVGLTLSLMFAERKAASGRQVFPIVLVSLLAQVALYYILGQSDAWRRFALWFIALPLT